MEFRKGLVGPKFAALDGVSLEVPEGEFFALLGQNGAGKSTAMYCFLGLIRPTSGSVRVFGDEPRPGAPLFSRVAYLPEEPQYPHYLTVGEALAYYAALYRLPDPRKAGAEILERLGLAEFRSMPVRKCSKGMKQKLGIAACLLIRPKLMLLDEPMRGLDPLAVKTFRDILVELHRDGTTIVMNSHLMTEVELVASRAAILDHGKLVALDAVSNLTRLAEEVYAVELEPAPDSPEAAPPRALSSPSTVGGRVHGTVAKADLPEFFEALRGSPFTLVSCARKRATLEESYLAIVGGIKRDA